MQIQLQRLMEARGEETRIIPRSNTGSNIEVATLQTFNGSSEKVRGFVTACRLYI